LKSPIGKIEGVRMARANFENLRIYELAEKLADQIWISVIRWEAFARDTAKQTKELRVIVAEL
jgi:hypothetical protein